MVAAAERFKCAKGYSNGVHLPCWPQLFANVSEVVFDGAYLPELKEFLHLIQFLFARSPYWRTKWCKFQAAAMENWTKSMSSCLATSKSGMRRRNCCRLRVLCAPLKFVGLQFPWPICIRRVGLCLSNGF